MLVGSAAAGCFVAACADIFGIHNAEVDASAVDGGSDVALDVPYDYPLFDAVDFDVNTALCGDGGVPFVDAGDAVWVSGKGTDNNQCGAQGNPCKSIGQALANRGARNVIYLDDSTFTEVVQLSTAVTVQGGWVQADGGWQAVCDNTGSIIEGPEAGGPAAVEVDSGGVTLRLLTVRSKVQGAQGNGVPVPESVYALRAVDSPNLLLDNVTLIAQNAGGGAPGTTPSGTITCTISGGDGGNGGTGNGGLGGTFSATGFNITSGGSGTPGSTGVYTAPGAGTCSSCNAAAGCP